MKKLFLFSFFTILFICCSKDNMVKQTTPLQCMSETEALESFAQILSSAVYENEELRLFLKEEALKQYDKDYDVFFPFVKDHIFSSGDTFYNILSTYAQEPDQLDAIEKSAPKLTIMIPDYSWINPGCFSVYNWDTSSNNVCVGYDDHDTSHRLYHDGELLGLLSDSSIPAFPVLIIKSNERMIVSPSATKSGLDYSFADQAFDGTNSSFTKGHTDGYLYNGHTEQRKDLYSETGNFVSYYELNSISPSSIGAYNEFGTGYMGAAQRDYILYGMTTSNTSHGVLNPYMRDLLYRIRFTPSALFRMSDDTGDPSLSTLYTGRDDRPGFDEVLSRLWGNGNYEIRIQYYQNLSNGGVDYIGANTYSIAPSEIMYISRLYYTFDWNFWGNNWSSYTIYSVDIEPKWYYPGDKSNTLSLVSTAWNLATASDNIWLKVSEYDIASTETYTMTGSFKQSFAVSYNETDNTWEKHGLGVSGTYGSEEVENESFNITRTYASDELGDCWLSYMDNIIISSATQQNVSGFQLKSIGNDYYSISYVPIDTRNEYSIQQILLNRKNR